VYNNGGQYTPEKCEVDSCQEHVGQGAGAPHLHGDPFGDQKSTHCLYGPSNYESVDAHPPVIGFSYDGHLIYGRYLSDDAPGYNQPALDGCGGHAHANAGTDEHGNDLEEYHYHTQIFDAFVGSKAQADEGQKYVVSAPGPFQCWKGDLGASEGSSALITIQSKEFNPDRLSNSDMNHFCCDMTDVYVGDGIEFPSGSIRDGVQTKGPSASMKSFSIEPSMGAHTSTNVDTTSTGTPATSAIPDRPIPIDNAMPTGSKPKNVLIFMPDDLGWLGWEEDPAHTSLKKDTDPMNKLTPHLNRVREEGVVFKRAYVSAPKCGPSRWGMMTGRHVSRGLFEQSRVEPPEVRAPIEVSSSLLSGADLSKTLAAELSKNGVHTIAAAKWHLAVLNGKEFFEPENYGATVALVEEAGFDDAVGVYITNFDTNGPHSFSHNLEWVVAEANARVDTAVAADEPFFLYVAPTNPHPPSNEAALTNFTMTDTPAGKLDGAPISGMPPRQAVINRVADFPSIQTKQRDMMIGAVGCDDALGALIANLEDKHGNLDETLVVVTTDHGAKDQIYEVGTRVWLAMRHPGSIAQRSFVSTPVYNLDLTPTILQALSLPASSYRIDGTSLWTAATNANDSGTGGVGAALGGRQCLGFEIDLIRSVVCGGRFKFVSGAKLQGEGASSNPNAGDPEQLYDLETDPLEQNNLLGLNNIAEIEKGLRSWVACHDADTNSGGVGCDTTALNLLGYSVADNTTVMNDDIDSVGETAEEGNEDLTDVLDGSDDVSEKSGAANHDTRRRWAVVAIAATSAFVVF
jgi:arylsulfatase A-like enzyme